MAKKPENKVTELFPGSIPVKMLDGRTAVIPPITLFTFCWIEETQEGGLAGFWMRLKTNLIGSVPVLSQILFDMLENKDDFKDITDFRKHFGLESAMGIISEMETLVEKSLPAIVAAAGSLGKGKKYLGGKSSAQSPSITPPTKSKTA